MENKEEFTNLLNDNITKLKNLSKEELDDIFKEIKISDIEDLMKLINESSDNND